MRTSPAAAAAGGFKAPNGAPSTACRARCCRARQAMGSQAAVTEASSLSVRMTWQRWHSMRSATPRPPPSVSVLTPLRELRGTFSPERLGAIQPLLVAVHSLIGEECTAPKRQRLRWPRWVGKGDRNFRTGMSTNEHFVDTLSELRVQQASIRERWPPPSGRTACRLPRARGNALQPCQTSGVRFGHACGACVGTLLTGRGSRGPAVPPASPAARPSRSRWGRCAGGGDGVIPPLFLTVKSYCNSW